MSDETDFMDGDDEMLKAIQEAFGDGAIDLLADSEEEEALTAQAVAEGSRSVKALEQNPADNTLDDLVDSIDQAIVSDEAPTQENRIDDQPDEEAVERFVVVQFGGSTLGIPMDYVNEIQTVQTITPLPCVPQWVLGVTNLRGNVISVVDFSMLFDLERSTSAITSRRMVLIQSLIDDVATGLVVDRVLGIRGFPASKIHQSSASSSNDMLARYMTGVTDVDDQLVALLDVDKLLLSPEFRLFDEKQRVTTRVSA